MGLVSLESQHGPGHVRLLSLLPANHLSPLTMAFQSAGYSTSASGFLLCLSTQGQPFVHFICFNNPSRSMVLAWPLICQPDTQISKCSPNSVPYFHVPPYSKNNLPVPPIFCHVLELCCNPLPVDQRPTPHLAAFFYLVASGLSHFQASTFSHLTRAPANPRRCWALAPLRRKARKKRRPSRRSRGSTLVS